MTTAHAVVRLDHENAQLMSLSGPLPVARRFHAKSHDTGHHRSDVRDGHEFFATVCDAIDGAGEALVVGARIAIADFERYVHKHRPDTARRIAAFQVVDHPTDAELAAYALRFFDRRSRLGGVFGRAE